MFLSRERETGIKLLNCHHFLFLHYHINFLAYSNTENYPFLSSMMPLYRRRHGSSKTSNESDNVPSTETSSQSSSTLLTRQQEQQQNANMTGTKTGHVFGKIHRKSATATTALVTVIVGYLLLVWVLCRKVQLRSNQQFMSIFIASIAGTFPIFLFLSVGLGLFTSSTTTTLIHQRYIPLGLVASIGANLLPVYVSSGLAALGIIIFGLATRSVQDGKKDDEKANDNDDARTEQSDSKKVASPFDAAAAVIILSAVMLTENFFIWVVSATFKPGQTMTDLPTPLQDNGQIILRHLFNVILQIPKRQLVYLRNTINVEWILVSGMGLSLVTIEVMGTTMKRSLFTLARRAVLTMAIARSIRTFSFIITVLPSQNPRCYFSHFPYPPPDTWSEWLKVGAIPQANGGCNDLIISGHATVTSTLACVVSSVVGNPIFSAALWMLVAMDYMIEVYEGFHYSVDMWLGAILVNLIWSVLAPIETAYAESLATGQQERQQRPQRFQPIQEATLYDTMRYIIPGVCAYLQVVQIIPESVGNYTILMFIIFVAFQIITEGIHRHTQHVLFCLLYVALGIYL